MPFMIIGSKKDASTGMSAQRWWRISSQDVQVVIPRQYLNVRKALGKFNGDMTGNESSPACQQNAVWLVFLDSHGRTVERDDDRRMCSSRQELSMLQTNTYSTHKYCYLYAAPKMSPSQWRAAPAVVIDFGNRPGPQPPPRLPRAGAM